MNATPEAHNGAPTETAATAVSVGQGLQTTSPAAVNEQKVTEATWTALVEKARQDEKSKVMPQIQSLTEKLAAAERVAAESAAEVLRLKAAASPDEAARANAAKLEAELRETAARTSKLEEELKITREVSAQELRKMQLNLHRERVLADKKVMLPELVVGNSEAEIEAAAERAIKRQNELAEAIRVEARREQSANVPSPISPTANRSVAVPSSPRDMGKLPRDRFEEVRAQLLADAMAARSR